jgi:hypothetical protein
LVDDLRKVERRTTDEIMRDIRSSTSDVLRIRLFGNLPNGRISVEEGARAFQKTRDLLLAAACAAVEKRPVYSRKKFVEATGYVNRAQFAPAESGSFVMVVETTVPPELEPHQQGLVLEEDPTAGSEPFNRTVGLTLARAAGAARRIIDQVPVTNSVGSIVDAVGDGVSSNLCEALAGLVDPDLSRSLELRFHWAATRLPKLVVPRQVVFESSISPFLSTIARTLREQMNIDEFEFVGPIYKLTSSSPELGGEISVSMVEPWRGRKVKVLLDARAYQRATLAHGTGQWISLEGELTRVGGSMVLVNPRNLRVLPIGGVEPDQAIIAKAVIQGASISRGGSIPRANRARYVEIVVGGKATTRATSVSASVVNTASPRAGYTHCPSRDSTTSSQ